MKKLTVILPAAGKGTRLSLPYAKKYFKSIKEGSHLLTVSTFLMRWVVKTSNSWLLLMRKTDIIKYLQSTKLDTTSASHIKHLIV